MRSKIWVYIRNVSRNVYRSIPASSVGRASDSYSRVSELRLVSECRGFEPHVGRFIFCWLEQLLFFAILFYCLFRCEPFPFLFRSPRVQKKACHSTLVMACDLSFLPMKRWTPLARAHGPSQAQTSTVRWSADNVLCNFKWV